ncbi:MAG: DUF4439 domain-containing protein [Actinobacteria bacterium]|nr:DUF4439 domain-containing protein [Actinomycetota bacterium]
MTPVEAWTAVVTGEDAAIYAYSIAGAQVPAGPRQRAVAGLTAHRSNRSRAAVELGGTPPPSSAGYVLPADVSTARGARAAMAGVDNALVAVYADAAAAAGADARRWAARTAAEYAVRAIGWGAEPQAFPAGPPSGQ